MLTNRQSTIPQTLNADNNQFSRVENLKGFSTLRFFARDLGVKAGMSDTNLVITGVDPESRNLMQLPGSWDTTAFSVERRPATVLR